MMMDRYRVLFGVTLLSMNVLILLPTIVESANADGLDILGI